MKIKENKAITLIALVITIIVLLILAGVSIALLTGENGILMKASTASEETKKQGALEKVQIAVSGSYGIDRKLNMSDLKNNLNLVEGVETITDVITSLPYKVTVDGYKILISGNGKVAFGEGGEWTGLVSSPIITSDMIPVYWDDFNNEIETNYSDTNWYDYNNQKWANAKTSDGSYWVWIPRYEYKITSGEGTSTAGQIDVKFISVDTTTADEGYKIHPAFQDGTANKYANGEWDKELSGIWVMKYEASSSNPTLENGGGNTTDLKVLSVPGVPSWRGITIGNSYTLSYNYDRAKQSHMMKNSEWGAIAYLAHSKYGRNATEVAINDNSLFYTGGGEGNSFKTNVAQSTTGNVTGIYDMSGGNWERVSAYINNETPNLGEYGGDFAMNTYSTKYTTVYPFSTVEDRGPYNYNIYKENIETRYGEAILETSTSGDGATAWFGDYTHYPRTDFPFFLRGGRYENGEIAGLFAFDRTNGMASINNGFRICIIF